MRNILAFTLVALTIAGCASSHSITPASGKAVSATASATLARVGTCEMDVAADYTALIASRYRAASLLRKKTITVEQAVQVQTLGDAARADLDAACPDAKAQLDVARRDRARAALGQIKTILEK